MFSIDAALEIIGSICQPLGVETIPLNLVVGRRLALPIRSDVDSPPHDKSLMDGFAVRAEDVQQLPVELRVLETVTAGQLPQIELQPRTASRIMTGAPLPRNADTVVMREMTQLDEGSQTVRVLSGVHPAGSYLLRRAQSMRRGDLVFDKGHEVRPSDVGLLAEVGCSELVVFQRPSLAVVSTGDELVEPSQIPGPGSIRNSNGPLLAALARDHVARVHSMGIVPDQFEALTERIRAAQSANVLLLSGGVSEGLLDLVPRALQTAGFEELFHKVAIKPGKPIWFGADHDRKRVAFGLPGNPVSSLCCFEVFVRVALLRLSGASASARKMHIGGLIQDHAVRGPRPTYWPCRSSLNAEGQMELRPLVWQGSSDLRCLAEANCFGFFPPRETPYPSGTPVEFLPIGSVFE